jgi:class 3 adenylate cyclase
VFYPTEHHEYEKQNPPSRMVLNRVLKESKVSWFDLYDLDQDCASLAGISSVVAAPVRARSGEVIAVLYGERRLRSLVASNKPLNRLDAMLTEVLAVGLAAGLARVSQERAALALQTQFEQFFTPELARVLAAQPRLLDGKDLEISVLFGDIRGFSRITSAHPPAFTLEWTHDVLSVLSECVLKYNGVLVDYIGDEIVAMWGAPDAQPDHAERACLAALDMLSALEELNERWAAKLGEPMGLGIGINTGIARVGNTGSSRKFKYGPLGSTVNVASRVQGASKYFKSSLLITRATRDQLGSSFQFRRIGTARVINISDPIELFELWLPNQPNRENICAAYEEALEAFENRDFQRATGILGRLVYNHHDDGPSFALLARAIACFVDQPENFDPAFRLPGK